MRHERVAPQVLYRPVYIIFQDGWGIRFPRGSLGPPGPMGCAPELQKFTLGPLGPMGCAPEPPWGPGEDFFEKQKVWRERGSNEKI